MSTFPDSVRPDSVRPTPSLALAAMGLLVMAGWMLSHPYTSIRHDAVLYSLFALRRLHPDTLSADIFLRFGSQDSFSLFTPIYAAVMSVFGLDHAAQLLTFLVQAVLLGCVWRLARQFMPSLDATLSVGLLLVLPAEYGAGTVFHLVEDFITARLPAEALVMGAVLAAVTRRYVVAAGCVIAAMLLHPVMGVVGAAFLVLTYLVPRYPRFTLTMIGVGFVAAVAVVVAIAPLGRVQDADWLFSIRSSSSFLFVTSWSVFDWTRIMSYLLILTIGCWVSTAPELRRICAGLLATVACGLVISTVFCDQLHVSLLIGVQAWRWLWLADMVAIAIAPAVLRDCWQRGYPGRIAVMTVGTAWVFRDLPPDLLLDAMAMAFAAVPAKWSGNRYWRPLLVAAYVLSGLAICLDISNMFVSVPEPIPHTSRQLQEVRNVLTDGVVPGVVLILGWIVLRGSVSNTAKPSLAPLLAATLAFALICWLLPPTWVSYTSSYFSQEQAARFAQWRAVIPPRAEVLWADNPVGIWSLLDRPSYTSAAQNAGAIFSRDKAVLVQHRAEAVTVAVRVEGPTLEHLEHPDRSMYPFSVVPLGLPAMRAICADPDLGFVVNWEAPAPTPFQAVTIDPSRPGYKLYLYRCADLRS